jgi:hypothetical protein
MTVDGSREALFGAGMQQDEMVQAPLELQSARVLLELSDRIYTTSRTRAR